jgi:hypothetical protein
MLDILPSSFFWLKTFWKVDLLPLSGSSKKSTLLGALDAANLCPLGMHTQCRTQKTVIVVSIGFQHQYQISNL